MCPYCFLPALRSRTDVVKGEIKQQNKNKQNRTEQMVKITLAIRKCEILEKNFKFDFD